MRSLYTIRETSSFTLKHQENRVLFRGSEGIERKPCCDCFSGLWSLVAMVLPPLDWVVIFHDKEPQELCKGRNKNTTPTVRPDSRGNTRNWAQRWSKWLWGLLCEAGILHLMIYGGDWGRVHLGCSLQPSADLEEWGSVSSHTRPSLLHFDAVPSLTFFSCWIPNPIFLFTMPGSHTRLPFLSPDLFSFLGNLAWIPLGSKKITRNDFSPFPRKALHYL